MVRNYKKKRVSEINEEDANRAVLAVVAGEMKLREAAAAYNIKPNTLHYRIKNYKEDKKPKSVDFTTKYSTSQIFNKDEEGMLKKYIITRSKMHYGLTYKQTRQLAFEYAMALGKSPEKWIVNREAGIEWLKSFMKRNRELSLRKPENTSLSRSTSFNKHNVTQFYDNYEEVLRRHNFSPDRIFNLDETSIMTVVQAPNVIAETGVKQVGQNVSAERGQLITMCGIGNAIGNSLPPVFIYPRARFHDSMLNGAPSGSVGYANSPTSGWMTGPLFIKVLEHIKKLVRCSKDDPILLLMDNHESHCTLEAINFCRESGIVVVTFPPHCTHRMQSLDVAVNGPFKQKLSVAQNDWLTNHPGKTITIHDLAGIVTPAYNQSYTAHNLIAGFSKPGIYPFSRNAFADDDFECAEVTNRPIPSTSVVAVSGLPISPPPPDDDITDCEDLGNDQADKCSPSNPEDSPVLHVAAAYSPLVSLFEAAPDLSSREIAERSPTDFLPTSIDIGENDTSLAPEINRNRVAPTCSPLAPPNIQTVMTPEDVWPIPRAPPRKDSSRGRKKGKSRILTDTPEKEEVQAAYLERQSRLKKQHAKVSKKRKENVAKRGSKISKAVAKFKGPKPSKRKSTKTVLSFSSHESQTDNEMTLESEEEAVMSCEDYTDDGESSVEMALEKSKIEENDFVLAEFSSQNNKRSLAFVGHVVEDQGNGFIVRFLKRKGNSYKFYFPEKEDRVNSLNMD